MPLKSLQKVILLFAFVFFGSKSFALTNENQLWNIVESNFAEVSTLFKAESALIEVHSLFQNNCQHQVTPTNKELVMLKEAGYWEKNYGIELRGGITTGDLDSSEIDDGSNTYLELSWDVLSSGYKEFDYRAKELRRRASLERLRRDLTNLSSSHYCTQQSIDEAFTGIHAQLLNSKITAMEPIFGKEQEAYFKGDAYYDEFLLSIEHLHLARLRLSKILDASQNTKTSIKSNNLPIIDIKIDSLISDVASDPRFHQRLIEENKSSISFNPYRDGNRLRLFLRKEFDVLNSNRDDLVAGLRFSTPLTFSKRPSYQDSLLALNRESELATWERIARVRSRYGEFSTQLERTITQHYRALRSQERMQRVLNRKALGETMVISAVTARLLNYIDAVTELMEAKNALYQSYNNVLLTSRLSHKSDYLDRVSLDYQNQRARPFERSLYIWSSAFNSLPLETIEAFSDLKSIDRFILSYSQKTNKHKLETFIAKSKQQDITLSLILGDNSWVYPEKHRLAAERVALVSAFHDNIHLDIEPQTFDDFKDRKNEYERDFVSLLQAIRNLTPDIKIGISVPFHWSLEAYKDAAEFADTFYLMNYGSVSNDARIRRVKNILQVIPENKLHIALRPSDFASEYEMENSIAYISQATGIEKFAIHDLDSYLTMAGSKP